METVWVAVGFVLFFAVLAYFGVPKMLTSALDARGKLVVPGLIDIHTHAEVSCWNPFDNYGEEYDRAADKFFGSNRRPTIDETVAYYREQLKSDPKA